MMDNPHLESTRRSRLSHFVRTRFLFVVAALFFIVAAFSYLLGKHMVYRAHPEFARNDQAEFILEKVSALIVLPAETPQIVIITDAQAVKQAQPFLARAENGDALIVYTQAGQAFLYRPSTNKLIAVGPVNAGSPPTVSTPSSSAPAPSSPDAPEEDTFYDAATTTDN